MIATMTKSEAIHLFVSVSELASALGISRQAVYKWPDPLPQEQADRIIGAAIRTGRMKRPSGFGKATEGANAA